MQKSGDPPAEIAAIFAIFAIAMPIADPSNIEGAREGGRTL